MFPALTTTIGPGKPTKMNMFIALKTEFRLSTDTQMHLCPK